MSLLLLASLLALLLFLIFPQCLLPVTNWSGLCPSRHHFLPEDSLTFSPWPRLQRHSQLELKSAHEASCLNFACLLLCMRLKVMHAGKVRLLNYSFQDLNGILFQKWPQTEFGFSQLSYKLQTYGAVLLECINSTGILRICLRIIILFLLLRGFESYRSAAAKIC